MNTRAGLLHVLQDLRQAADDPALGTSLRYWIAPALFALLVSVTIRVHSIAPMATMSRVVANLLAVAAIALAVLLARGCRFSISRDIALLLSALAAAAAISVLGSGSAGVSLVRLELYLAVVLLSTVVYLAHRHQGRLPVEAYCLAVAVVHLPFLFAVVHWVSGLEPPISAYGWRVGDFAHVRQFGEFGFLAAASATACGLLARRLAIPSFVLATCAVFGIVLTGSRGAFLSWVLFCGLLCCFSRARVLAMLHGLLVLGLSTGLVWYLDQSGLLPSPNLFRRAGQVGFDSGRIELWRLSLEQIMTRPLFGSGPEGYWLSGCCDRRILQAHNFVLQFLMEFGVVGCGIAVLLAARAVKAMGGLAATTERVLATPANRVLACLLAAFLAYSLIDQMMYHLLPLVHLALFAGLFAAGLVSTSAVEAGGSIQSTLPDGGRMGRSLT